MQCSEKPAGDGSVPPDWRGYAPKVQPTPPPAPTHSPLRQRLTRFVALWAIRTCAHSAAFVGFCILATGQI